MRQVGKHSGVAVVPGDQRRASSICADFRAGGLTEARGPH